MSSVVSQESLTNRTVAGLDHQCALDVNGLGLFYTKASDEAMQPDGEGGNNDWNADSDSGSDSEDSNCSNCSGDLIVAMYESDQGDSDLEDYKF